MKDTPMGSGPQHTPRPQDVKPASTGDYLTPPAKAVKPKATSGDKERPVMKQVQRRQPIVSAKRPKHESVRKAFS